jgi:hypothetical protein
MTNIERVPIKYSAIKKRNITVHTSGDVKKLINITINELRNEEMDSKRANAIGYLANILLKAFEAEELAKKVGELEERMEQIISDKSR